MKTSVYVEFYGEQVSKEELVKEAEKIWNMKFSAKLPQDRSLSYS